MEAIGVQKLYEPSPKPILYAGLAADVLGRVPLMPLFFLGNYTPTIPHPLSQHRSARFPHGLADAADESGRMSSQTRRLHLRLVCCIGRLPGPKAPQGSHGGRGPWRTGIGYP